MVLSNAERQRRFRERLKAKASGGDLPAMIRAAVLAGFRARYAAAERLGFADFDGIASADALVELTTSPSGRKRAGFDPIGDMLSLFEDDDAYNDDERAAIKLARDAVQAILLRNE